MRNKGFTLIELLVVIAIVGILVAVVVVALDDSRRTSRNTAVLSQMYEYHKAMELQYTSTGFYPATNAARNHRYCFGDGLVNGTDCITPLTTNYNEAASAGIVVALRTHLSALPRFRQAQGSSDWSSPAYSGCIGNGLTDTSCTIADYSFWFLLEGNNEDCGRAMVVDSSYGGGQYTLCRLLGE